MTTYNFIDRTGQIFGRLTVTGRSPNQKGRTMWSCLCSCGNHTIIRGEHLRNKASTSCGCYSKESHTKHGRARTPEYQTWQNMKERCYNKKDKGYHNYGGRGITVCDRWMDSFESFFEDMGERKSVSHSIDRIDNNKGYYHGNCRWATPLQQVENRRNSILYTINGETKCLKIWCKHYQVNYSTARYHHQRGASINKILKLHE